jgi:hypothetical protein
METAGTALRTVADAVDAITVKAIQLEGLLVAMSHAAKSDDMPPAFMEASLWLACDVVREIRCAVGDLS